MSLSVACEALNIIPIVIGLAGVEGVKFCQGVLDLLHLQCNLVLTASITRIGKLTSHAEAIFLASDKVKIINGFSFQSVLGRVCLAIYMVTLLSCCWMNRRLCV